LPRLNLRHHLLHLIAVICG